MHNCSLASKAFSRSGGSNCVLHKHCVDKVKLKSVNDAIDVSGVSDVNSSTGVSRMGDSGIARTERVTSDASEPNKSERRSSSGQRCHNGSPFQWQFNRKRKYSRSLHRHRRHGIKGRPNSLLLPIDESEELQESVESCNETTHNQQSVKSSSSASSSISSSAPSSSPLLSSDVQPKPIIEDKKPIVCPPLVSTSRFSTTLLKAKNWIKRGKMSAQ